MVEQKLPKPPLPIREAFERGWELLWDRFWLVAGVVFFIGLVEMFFGSVQDGLDPEGPIAYLTVAYIAELLATSLLVLGYVSILFRLYDGVEAKFADLFSQTHRLGTYILATVMFLALACAGTVLLVVPGLFALVAFNFYREALVDRRLNAWESLKVSLTITRGYRWPVAGFLLMTTAINLIGLLTGGVGLVLTVPISMIASIHLYRFLFQQQLPQEERAVDQPDAALKASDPAQAMTSSDSTEENREPGIE